MASMVVTSRGPFLGLSVLSHHCMRLCFGSARLVKKWTRSQIAVIMQNHFGGDTGISSVRQVRTSEALTN